MPAVLLTVSETLNGAAVSDALNGGGLGIDYGSILNKSYGPLGAGGPADNSGFQAAYVRHDGANPITNLRTMINQFGTLTGFTYGGAESPSDDFTTLKNLANASGDSKNNADGLSGGVWIDMDSDGATINQFDYANNGFSDSGGSEGGNDTVRKYGDALNEGIDINSAFPVKAAAMVYDSGGESQPSAPVDEQVGEASNSVLGDNFKAKLRGYLPENFDKSGVIQFEWVLIYAFSS